MTIILFITFEVWFILTKIIPKTKTIKVKSRAERKRLLMIADDLQEITDKIFYGGKIGMEEDIVIRNAKETLEEIAR